MTQQVINNNSKLLAEFLGWETDSVEMVAPEQLREAVQFGHNKEYFTTTIFKHRDAKFRNDWNWLMQVVMCINTLDNDNYTVKINSMDVEIHSDKHKKMVVEYFSPHSPNNLLMGLYEACVQFVKWYNQNKGGN